MKLFVDDERPAPAGWVLAMTPDAAIANLEHARIEGYAVEKLSLDHDLGMNTDTGSDPWIELDSRPIVLWMCENDWWPTEVYIHTGNPVAEEWLVGMVRRYAPAYTLKGYGLNYWGTGPDSVIRNEVNG